MSGDGPDHLPESSTKRRRSRYEGIVVRHSRSCGSRGGGRCSCGASFQAQVWSARERKTIRKTFRELGEARAWRQRSQVALRKGLLRSPSQTTLEEAADEWLAAAETGLVRTRSGEAYKPAAIRAYRQALNQRVLPQFGQKRLSSITFIILQDFADRLSAQGLSPSTVRNTLLPFRAIFRRAHARGQVAVNPTVKLALPAVRGRRDRVAAPTEVGPLLDALLPADRAIYATALYAGLRCGELQALHWDDIDLDQPDPRRRSWDRHAGFIAPKSRSGNRASPITPTLRRELQTTASNKEKAAEASSSPTAATRPFNPGHARAPHQTPGPTAGLTPIGLHECRHSYAAYMIAAGVNTKALSTYMGHSSITITLDRYGHLLPGNEPRPHDLLDTWLKQAALPNGPQRARP